MELKVQWTKPAIIQLEQVFDYHKTMVNLAVARQLTKRLFQRTKTLGKHPRKGAKEGLLNGRQKEYRYLLEGNYKIIYWIEEEKEIFIAAIYDCRQNPEKLNSLPDEA